jgi:hypothetical protein
MYLGGTSAQEASAGMTQRRFVADQETIAAATALYLAGLDKAQGRPELFTHQSPQRLNVLREHALKA